jgi:putative phosphoesterase
MIIAVGSDCHGLTFTLLTILKSLPKIDAFCFLGDVSTDAMRIKSELALSQPAAQFYSVCGNNDYRFSRTEPEDQMITLSGKRIFMTHGHRYRVKQGIELLASKAVEVEADLVLYGHTHIPKQDYFRQALLLNPGAMMDGRYSLITIDENGITPKMLRRF